MESHRGRGVTCAGALFVAALFAATASEASEPATKATPPPATAPAAGQPGPVIKDVYQKHFLIGTAGDFPGNYSDAERALAKPTSTS